jgi:uncharacterized peroxidase-related enzyme
MNQNTYIHALGIKETEIKQLDKDLRDYFELCNEKIGFIPNVLRSYSWNIKKLRAFTQFYNEVMLGESKLSKLEKEMIATVVSSANRCHYCQVAHSSGVRQYSEDRYLADSLIMDYKSAKLSNRHQSMLDFSWKLTENPRSIEEEDRQKLRSNGFTDEEIWDICEVVSFFNMTNRLASGVSMTPNKEYYDIHR